MKHSDPQDLNIHNLHPRLWMLNELLWGRIQWKHYWWYPQLLSFQKVKRFYSWLEMLFPNQSGMYQSQADLKTADL